MSSNKTPVVQRYDDPRLFGISVEEKGQFLSGKYYNPVKNPSMWKRYLDAAEQSYAKHGVANAVRRSELEISPCPSFWLIQDCRNNEVLGGLRNHGPYPTLDSVWSLHEMKTHSRFAELQAFVGPLLGNKVMENKGVFVHPDVDRGRTKHVIDMILRLQIISIDLIGAAAMVGTSAQHTMGMWARSGCEVVCPDISVPYPNPSYKTVLVAHITANRKKLMDAQLLRTVENDLLNIQESLSVPEAV